MLRRYSLDLLKTGQCGTTLLLDLPVRTGPRCTEMAFDLVKTGMPRTAIAINLVKNGLRYTALPLDLVKTGL